MATLDLELPEDFNAPRALAYLGRDPKSRVQRVEGDTVRFAVPLGADATVVTVRLADGRATVELSRPVGQDEVHRRVVRLLGLGSQPDGGQRHGLRIPQTHDVADGLVWVIAGQQVSLAAAFSIRGRLIERFGRRVEDPRGELRLPPDLALVAESSVDELRTLGLTLRKSEYLLDLSRQVTEGELDLAALERAAPEEIEKRLLACRGLGPWSVHYLMMRSFTLPDAVPAGDVALAESLKRYFQLDERPDPKETRRLMEPFAPYRSLATFHFWNRLGNAQ